MYENLYPGDNEIRELKLAACRMTQAGWRNMTAPECTEKSGNAYFCFQFRR
jgi:hypothetical protein